MMPKPLGRTQIGACSMTDPEPLSRAADNSAKARPPESGSGRRMVAVMKPVLSVAIPAHDEEKYIARCIESNESSADLADRQVEVVVGRRRAASSICAETGISSATRVL